jgi:ATP-dependent protease ClpP protease subunit
MLKRVALCLLLSACAGEEFALVDDVLTTPALIRDVWADKAIELINQGKVTQIRCVTRGGDASAALRVVEALQQSPRLITVIVPAGDICASAGAIVWFGAKSRCQAPYEGAEGRVTLHPPGTWWAGVDRQLALQFADILTRAGATQELRDRFLHQTWKDFYTLTHVEVRKYSTMSYPSP